MLQHICLIINPASGADLPVLAYLNRALNKFKITAEIKITQKKGDATRFAQEALAQQVEAVAVYGGDGTVMEVAQALCYQNLPLLILPGGTANILAKELNLPMNGEETFSVLGKPQHTSTVIDMAECNRTPFLLRLNTGLLAEMILDTSRTEKDKLGTLAYALSAFNHRDDLSPVTYKLAIDDLPVQEISGVAMMITNVANIGLPGVSLLPDIRFDDGSLDVLVMQSADLSSLIKLATSTFTPLSPPPALQHWPAKKIQVTLPPGQPLLLDDRKFAADQLNISILPQALTLLS